MSAEESVSFGSWAKLTIGQYHVTSVQPMSKDGFSFVDLVQDDDRPQTYYALKRILCQTTDQLSSVHMELARWYRRSSSSGLLLLANVVPDCSPSAEACMLFSALHASIELDSDDQAVEAVVDQWHDWLPTLLNPSMDDDSSPSCMTPVSTSSAATSKKRHQRPERTSSVSSSTPHKRRRGTDAQSVSSSSPRSHQHRIPDAERIDVSYLHAEPLGLVSSDRVFVPIDVDACFDAFEMAMKETKRKVHVSSGVATIPRLHQTVHRGARVLVLLVHGGDGSLVFEDESTGMAAPTTVAALRGFLQPSSSNEPFPIRLVFLAACHSQKMGHAFRDMGVDHVICTDASIQVGALQDFQRFFFLELIGCGSGVKASYEKALAGLKMGQWMVEANKFKFLSTLQAEPSHVDEQLFNDDSFAPGAPVRIGEGLVTGTDLIHLPAPPSPADIIDRSDALKSIMEQLRQRRHQTVGIAGRGRKVLGIMAARFAARRRWYTHVHHYRTLSQGWQLHVKAGETHLLVIAYDDHMGSFVLPKGLHLYNLPSNVYVLAVWVAHATKHTMLRTLTFSLNRIQTAWLFWRVRPPATKLTLPKDGALDLQTFISHLAQHPFFEVLLDERIRLHDILRYATFTCKCSLDDLANLVTKELERFPTDTKQ